jgi:hypothetical protein
MFLLFEKIHVDLFFKIGNKISWPPILATLEAQVGEYQSETPLLFSPASSKQAEDPI